MLQENAGLAEEKGRIKDANKEREESERKKRESIEDEKIVNRDRIISERK